MVRFWLARLDRGAGSRPARRRPRNGRARRVAGRARGGCVWNRRQLGPQRGAAEALGKAPASALCKRRPPTLSGTVSVRW